MAKIINLNDFQKESKKILSEDVYNFISSGSGDEVSLANNIAGFANISLRPRCLRLKHTPNQTINLFNHFYQHPFMVAPMAFHKLVHSDGEIATAQAAQKNRVPMCVSTMSTIDIETIKENTDGSSLWFQLYFMKDRNVTLDLIKRAELSGYEALIVTIDVPELGRRESNIRDNFALPNSIAAANFLKYQSINDKELSALNDGSSVADFTTKEFESFIGWEDIIWIKNNTNVPIILKGILTVDDAELAVAHGINGIIISNHGGRQLDTTDPLKALYDISEKLKGRITLLYDSGIRRGIDVIKALALGADAVLLGRPILFALSIDGKDGVDHALALLAEEVRQAMLFCGCESIIAVKNRGLELLDADWIKQKKLESSLVERIFLLEKQLVNVNKQLSHLQKNLGNEISSEKKSDLLSPSGLFSK